MNTRLMLRLADEIEARPQDYDQRTGSGALHGTCPACLAVHALRLAEGATAGRDPTWSRTAAAAAEVLDLDAYEAGALFASNPPDTGLEANFPVSIDGLDAIPELANWLVDVDRNGNTVSKRLHHAAANEGAAGLEASEARRVQATYFEFWNLDPGASEAERFQHASARVMAATLRLIAAGVRNAAAAIRTHSR